MFEFVQPLRIEGGSGEANRVKRSFHENLTRDFNSSCQQIFTKTQQKDFTEKELQELQTQFTYFSEKIPVNGFPAPVVAELTSYIESLDTKQDPKKSLREICGYLKNPVWVDGLADMAKLPNCQWLPRFDPWNYHTLAVAQHEEEKAIVSSIDDKDMKDDDDTQEKNNSNSEGDKDDEDEEEWVKTIDDGLKNPERPDVEVPRPECPKCKQRGKYSSRGKQTRRSDEPLTVYHTCKHPLHKGDRKWIEK